MQKGNEMTEILMLGGIVLTIIVGWIMMELLGDL
jgi:hypothetical protein